MKYRNTALLLALLAAAPLRADLARQDGTSEAAQAPTPLEQKSLDAALDRISLGRAIFRRDTFGNQVFWGDALRLHEAIAGRDNGGTGPGLSPNAALELGLKVDVNALPVGVRSAIRQGRVDLDSPATTLALLKLDSVVGVRGFFDDTGTRLRSVGITCALCHSTVDDSFGPGNR